MKETEVVVVNKVKVVNKSKTRRASRQTSLAYEPIATNATNVLTDRHPNLKKKEIKGL